MSESRTRRRALGGSSPPGALPHEGDAHHAMHDATREAAARLATHYWRRNLATIAILMAIGFAVSFIGPFWARELSGIRFLGWPLPFYLGAQGTLLTYLLLVICYAGLQRRNDLAYRRALAALHAGVTPSGS